MCAVALDVELAAMYLASEVDTAISVGMVELASMRALMRKILHRTVDWPVSG